MEKTDLWDGKRYHSLDFELKQRFGIKIAKLALDAGMTCPTRDGTKGSRGCLFCSSRGSGDFTQAGGITEQMERQSRAALQKWPKCAFIAYFQSFTNTYAPVVKLRSLFDEALAFPGTVGLAVATRCDCLSDEVLELLSEYNRKTFLWVELGLQTSSDETGRLIRRGFETRDFDEAVMKLDKLKILSVVHLIVGLPGENRDVFLKTVKHITSLPVWGIKIQMLHVLKDADLYGEFLENPFALPEQDDYIETVCDALEILRPDMVVHRLTGDGKRENLIAPLWTINKRQVLSEINNEMRRRKSTQGMRSQ